MGEMADWHMEQMEDFMLDPDRWFGHYPTDRPGSYRRNFQRGVGRHKWRNADGEVIDMWKMDERYLRNCLRLCEQHGNTGKAEDLREVLSHYEEYEQRKLGTFSLKSSTPKAEPMTSTSKNSSLISLLQAKRGMTTVKVAHEDGKQDDDRIFTYKKLPDLNLSAGDKVVVETKYGLTVGTVKSIDDFADIDLDSDFHYRWIVQRVDLDVLNSLQEEEKNAGRQFAAAEAQQKLENLAKHSGIDFDKIETPMLSGKVLE